MKKTIWFVLLAAAIMIALLIGGCSDDDEAPTQTIIIGEGDDASFDVVSEIFEESGIVNSFERTADLTGALIDEQFGDKSAGLKKMMAPSDDPDSISISALQSYNYENGWHIWLCSAVVYVEGVAIVDAEAIDSLQMRIEGTPQAVPSDDVDALEIHAWYNWETRDGTQEASAKHWLLVTMDLVSTPNTLTIEADIMESHLATFSDDSSECELEALFDEDIDDLEFDLDAEGEPVECPNSGEINIRGQIGLLCTNEYSPMDTLMIDGFWDHLVEVLDDGRVRFMYTDGTITFITTKTCGEESTTASASLWLFKPEFE